MAHIEYTNIFLEKVQNKFTYTMYIIIISGHPEYKRYSIDEISIEWSLFTTMINTRSISSATAANSYILRSIYELDINSGGNFNYILGV